MRGSEDFYEFLSNGAAGERGGFRLFAQVVDSPYVVGDKRGVGARRFEERRGVGNFARLRRGRRRGGFRLCRLLRGLLRRVEPAAQFGRFYVLNYRRADFRSLVRMDFRGRRHGFGEFRKGVVAPRRVGIRHRDSPRQFRVGERGIFESFK